MTLLNAKILSAYSYFFMRIRRTQGNFLNVYGEYGEFRVVCGKQNLLTERIYAYIEKTPRDTILCISQLKILQILNFFRFFLSSLYGTD
jgi:hypothetical protein